MLPELDLVGHQPVAAPAVGAGHVGPGEPAPRPRAARPRAPPGSDRPALRRRPHADPARTRAGVPVGVGLVGRTPARPFPSARTWRSTSGQCRRIAACGLASSSSPLRLSKLVKKQNPRSSTPRRSTRRTDGAPSRRRWRRSSRRRRGRATAASSYQPENCTNGSSATAVSELACARSGRGPSAREATAGGIEVPHAVSPRRHQRPVTCDATHASTPRRWASRS